MSRLSSAALIPVNMVYIGLYLSVHKEKTVICRLFFMFYLPGASIVGRPRKAGHSLDVLYVTGTPAIGP